MHTDRFHPMTKRGAMKLFKEIKNSIFLGSTFLVALIFCSVTFASANTYPTDGWQSSAPEKQGMLSQMLASMVEEIKMKGYNIDNISIIRNGYMVLDAYFYPFSKGQRHLIHSCTKSIMSILIGIAIDRGYIKSVDQPIVELLPHNIIDSLGDNKRSITLEHLVNYGLWFRLQGLSSLQLERII